MGVLHAFGGVAALAAAVRLRAVPLLAVPVAAFGLYELHESDQRFEEANRLSQSALNQFQVDASNCDKTWPGAQHHQ
jgi:hypothetical protein